MNNLLDAALAFYDAGYCVVPARSDGTKAPVVTWKQYQYTRPERAQVVGWLEHDGYDGFGLICGAVSGQLEMFELEGRAVAEGLLTELTTLAAKAGLGPLWRRLGTGYFEASPSGGIHLLYRVDGAAKPNTKLAVRPARPDEYSDKERAITAKFPDRVITRTLIETRGEEGFTIVAPSGGRTHPEGKSWALLQGSLTTIPVLSEDERDALYSLARSLDSSPRAEPPSATGRTVDLFDTGGLSPGDDYNARADWSELLGPLGWTPVYTRGEETFWRRDGKTIGLSASTNYKGSGNLWVWSTSTEFEAERSYTKFGALTHLQFGDDFSAAAKGLRGAGFGAAVPEQRRPAVHREPSKTPDEDDEEGDRDSDPDAPSTYSHTDDGNALRLVDEYGNSINHCADRGRWLAWNGHAWQWCDTGAGPAREHAKHIARRLGLEDKNEARHRAYSLSARGTTNMLLQAASDPRIRVSFTDLDAHAFELNTPAGIVDLRTGKISAPDPVKLHTRSTICAPDPAADPRSWQIFLTDTFGDDTEMIEYLQRLVGYSATGTVGRHVLPFCFGSGGNGKGVFLETVTGVLGTYATTSPNGFLMARQYTGHETEIARLSGVRMVLCSEVNEHDKFDEARVKQLTGGDTLTARFMHQDHFSFTPTHHLWLMGNNQPQVDAGGDSFWRRLRLIPFTRTVSDEKRVDDLQGILKRDHGPAVLAWIVEGAVAYLRDGLQEPAAVKAATSAYAESEDSLGRFVEERCLLGGGDIVTLDTKHLRTVYEAWCAGEGIKPMDARTFGRQLKGRYGVERHQVRGGYRYVGISLVEPEGAESADSGWGDR